MADDGQPYAAPAGIANPFSRERWPAGILPQRALRLRAVGAARSDRRLAGRPGSAAVPQARRDAVDREVDPLHHPLLRIAGAVAPQKLDLHVVERIEIGEAVLDRARQKRVLLEQHLLPGD